MTLLSPAILVAASLLSQLRDNINTITLQTVREPEKTAVYRTASDNGYENGSDMRELFLKVPVDDEEAAQIISLQDSSGRFTDIDYSSSLRGAWPVSMHAFRVCRMAVRYVKTADRGALDCALKGMRFWASEMPHCRNWWHNEIGIPRLMGPAYLLLMDEMTQDDIAGAIRVMGKAKIYKTGQNKVWLAGNVLIRGILEGNEALVREARDTIVSEIRISDDREGLQDDWSFHQHGSQLQFGNYGLSYAVSLSFWAKAFAGTDLALSEDNFATLRNYVEKGLCKVIWNGWFDHNACGRQVFLNAQMGKAVCALEAAGNLGVTLSGEPGAVYYPKSDFGIYTTGKWYASIRMQSTRVKGYETTNNENTLGYFSSDGALLLRRRGDEYNNVSPVWNWRHVPGTTAWDDGTPPLYPEKSYDENAVFNNSAKVGGEVLGKDMVAWMEIDRDGLKAHKMWVFTDECIVCLGSGITMKEAEGRAAGSSMVATTLNQCLLRGDVTKGDGWVRHDSVTYYILDNNQYKLNIGPHKGSWRPISPTYPDREVSADLFEMYICHGARPSNASYAYVIVPDGEFPSDRVRDKVRIHANTPGRQSVSIGGKKFTVDWKKFTIGGKSLSMGLK